LCLACGFRGDRFFGSGLIGGAGVDGSSCGFGAHGAVFALAVEEQPATGSKDQGRYDEYRQPHTPTARVRLAGV
jgi:hypothetical protein